MGKALTVEIPDELYASLKELSKDGTDREIGEQLVRISERVIQEGHRRLNDPIFKPLTPEGSGASDVSERHDDYLYRSSG